MLKVAVKHYLKSIGDSTFVANPDYPEFVSAECLAVVIKRKPKWCWQRPIYTYDNFGLNDLLEEPLPEDKSQFLLKAEELSPNFLHSSKHNVNGKIEGKLASLASLDVNGNDSVALSIDFQNMAKQSINFSAVQNMLKTKKVNLQSKYVKRLAQNKYNVICLVSQYLFINKPTEIKVTVNRDIDGSVDVNENKVGTVDKESYQNNVTKSIIFDAGTKIAFNFSECLISPDGTIELLDKFEEGKAVQMIPRISQKISLPNQSAKIIMKTDLDVLDGGDVGNLSSLFKSLSSFLNGHNVHEMKKHLLKLSLENKSILRKLELFLLLCKQETMDPELGMNSLNIFDEAMMKDVHLIKFFDSVGVDIKEDKFIVRKAVFNQDLLEGITCFVSCIYHLEKVQLEDLLNIISKNEPAAIIELTFFLQNLKFLDFFNEALYQRLIKDVNKRRLLMSVGVQKSYFMLNEYLEPVMILLYGDY